MVGETVASLELGTIKICSSSDDDDTVENMGTKRHTGPNLQVISTNAPEGAA